MEIMNSLKDGFVKFTYEMARLHTFTIRQFINIGIYLYSNRRTIRSLLVEKYIICMNSKDFKTELGGQQDINFLINKSMSACQK